MAEAAKKRGIHRIASLADDYDKEHDIQPLAHQPQIPEESVEEHDAPLVPNPKPLKDFRSLPPSRMETRDLISLYWQDVAAAQAQKKPERGSLSLQLGYNVRKGHICVKVLQGHNLPVLDPTGKSDPYISIQAFPFDVFEDSAAKTQQTGTKKKDLNPVYMEMFHFRCKPSAITHDKAAAILFTAYDYDMISGDDLMGEAVHLLPGTKEVDNESEVGSLDVVVLPLLLPLLPTDIKSHAYAELEKRTSDKHAVKFIEERVQVFDEAKSERK